MPQTGGRDALARGRQHLEHSTGRAVARGKMTEAEHAVKGDTSNKVMKQAKLETGADIMVPIFVEAGTVIRVDTETGDYLDRVKK